MNAWASPTAGAATVSVSVPVVPLEKVVATSDAHVRTRDGDASCPIRARKVHDQFMGRNGIQHGRMRCPAVC